MSDPDSPSTPAPVAGAEGEPTLRPADPVADRAALLALWRSVFGAYSDARYDWLYRDNPHGAACFVLDRGAGRLAGAASVAFREMKAGGRPIQAAQAIDFAVEKALRIGGHAITLQRRLQSECRRRGVALLYGFPLPGAAAVQRRVGFADVGRFERWVLPLRCEYKLSHCRPALLRRPLAAVVDLGLSLAWRRPNRLARRLHAECRPDFGEAAARLDEENRNGFPVVGRRDRRHMQWRFAGAENRVFELSAPDGAVCGYVVYAAEAARVRIRDLFALDPDHARALMVAFIRAMYADGANRIELNMLADAEWRQCLGAVGFRPRGGGDDRGHGVGGHGLENRAMAMWLDGREAGPTSGWFLTEADKDA